MSTNYGSMKFQKFAEKPIKTDEQLCEALLAYLTKFQIRTRQQILSALWGDLDSCMMDKILKELSSRGSIVVKGQVVTRL